MRAGIIKYFTASLLLLAILHYESVSFSGVKLSHIWKGVLLVLLLSAILKRGRIKLYHYSPLAILALLNVTSFEIINNPFNAIITLSTVMLLAFAGAYSQTLSLKTLERALIFYSVFCILSFLPYQLGLLSSLSEGYDLSGFGEENQKGIIGAFQKVHSASPVLACALLVLIAFFFGGKIRLIYFAPLLSLGLYFLFFTYVRTGIVMFLLGLIPIVRHYLLRSSKGLFKLFLVAALLLAMLFNTILTNDLLMSRIKGERLYYSEDSVETYGSGRLRFSIAAINYFSESNIAEKIIGIGETEGLNRMEAEIGQRLFPHNGILFILTTNGIMGLLFFGAFLRNLYREQRSKKSDSAVLASSMLIAYIALVMLQSYDLLYVFVYLALAYAYMNQHHVQVMRVAHESRRQV